jgi:competence protein ComEA
MKIKAFLGEYFNFTKSEKHAYYFLLGLLALLLLFNLIMPLIIPGSNLSNPDNISNLKAFRDLAKKLEEGNNKYNPSIYKFESENMEYRNNQFTFDPNTASSDQWLKLGVSRKTIQIIENYKNKGGKFYNKEDVKKIYGITPELFRKLENRIAIKSEVHTKSEKAPNLYFGKRGEVVEINSACEEDLMKLPGIGKAFSERIIKYRAKIGGYYSPDQLKEVYGLDSQIYNKIDKFIMVDDARIKKIPLNLADVNILGQHPYIGYKKAYELIKFRNKYGPFKSILEIKSKGIITDEKEFDKISRYLQLWL